jgi:hypothetical protein
MKSRGPAEKKLAGFTLLEFIIYIGLVTFVLAASVVFAHTLIDDQAKQELLIEVNEDGGFVLDKLSYYIQRADSVDAQTVYNTSPGKLVLNFFDGSKVIFDTFQKQITLGDSTVNVTKLRMQRGTDPAVELVSDKITVTNFAITNLSSAGATVLKINLSLAAVNPSNSQTYAAQNSWTTSATLRKK